MGEGKRCPACGNDIGFWAVFSALAPSLIRCGHCRAQVRYRDTGHTVVIVGTMILGSALLTAFAAVLMSSTALPLRLVLLLPVWVLSWMVMELLATQYLRSRGTLERTPPPAGWFPDPTGRYQQRYWDSVRWTSHVATDGMVGVDESGAAEGQ